MTDTARQRACDSLARRLLLKTPPVIEYDDLMQEGFIGWQEAMRRWEPSRGTQPSTLGYAYARGHMLHYIRATLGRGPRNPVRRPDSFEELVETGASIPTEPGPEEPTWRAVLHRTLHRRLAKLDPYERQTLVMHYVRGVPLYKIAALMLLSLEQVRTLQRHGLRKLREAMGVQV